MAANEGGPLLGYCIYVPVSGPFFLPDHCGPSAIAQRRLDDHQEMCPFHLGQPLPSVGVAPGPIFLGGSCLYAGHQLPRSEVREGSKRAGFEGAHTYFLILLGKLNSAMCTGATASRPPPSRQFVICRAVSGYRSLVCRTSTLDTQKFSHYLSSRGYHILVPNTPRGPQSTLHIVHHLDTPPFPTDSIEYPEKATICPRARKTVPLLS